MQLQPLDVLGGVMFFAGLLVITGLFVPAVVASERLGTGASLMVLGTAAVAGPRTFKTALDN
ncbi:hypothetical protein E6P09_04400 [Haloferax mediterranei ATCC 33500]|uniref:Uncharacterized protein n=1 Tax=Haloferax mediterranei (strain ATCC 33500 / DSM 1411 / JCM 8866 / NBRC 14739 / NCIMB 2177 / R-4) TaxID=523841 RepID=I3R193_HALMT|nr:hypothetical protein [Haloferax mediterranei]AFK18003.1 hypothetical protein HFX_0262 [Haloferax mediterranei ATCC 33500]AHZ22579.1 hypothetical protein BM92_07940 [Haloferax mediterranei ATCC 33500]EMA02721.1 hypothetical protein C439_09060 [Haloferax mediterranei ATCC 33500]MDX5988095.1 hypothetical protein [Haloferax mediterranei ATCC 33500]QCQ74547.1 hypothetical protein E6P09_04400 [Haloferax mediterranei ATCC 33500]